MNVYFCRIARRKEFGYELEVLETIKETENSSEQVTLSAMNPFLITPLKNCVEEC
jgi:hypothetical protein